MTQQLKDHEEEIEELEKKVERRSKSELEEAKKDSSTKDGEIAVLKQTVDGQQAHARSASTRRSRPRWKWSTGRRAFFGDSKYVWRGKSDDADEARGRGGSPWRREGQDDGRPDDVEGAFLSITEPEVQDGVPAHDCSRSRGAGPHGNYNDAAAKAYDKRNEELANRWKKNKKPFGATA